MDLLINGIAVNRSSLGVKRYFNGVFQRLDWPGRVEITPLPAWRTLERPLEIAQRGRTDAIFWSPSHRGPLAAHNHVITVHDCINVEFTHRRDWRLPLFRRLFNRTLKNACAIATNSNATRDAVLRNYDVDPGKVIAIPGPVHFNEPSALANARERPSARAAEPFVLMIVNPLPHKNTERAVRAFAASSAARKGIALRVVGGVEPGAVEASRVADCRLDVHARVSDETLSDWLAQCLFLLSPSLEEGLNLPIAEALNHGANVLCSDIAVHREFYDGQVAWCDPLRTDSIAEALDQAFDRSGPWCAGSRPASRISFDDVSRAYRQLFLRVASREALSTSIQQ